MMAIRHGCRVMRMVIGLTVALAVFGCSPSIDTQATAPSEKAPVAEERPVGPLDSASRAVPSILTEPPVLPRSEGPMDFAANAMEQPADAGLAPTESTAAEPLRTEGEPSVLVADADRPNPLRAGGAEPLPLTAALSAAAADRPLVAAVNPPLAAETPSIEAEKPLPEAKNSSTDAAKPRIGKQSGVPFDPIKINGPIFNDWPTPPKVAIVITGMEQGYIEPCGCAGLDWMKGGMTRRHTMFETLHNWDWPTEGKSAPRSRDMSEDLHKRDVPVIGLDVGGIASDRGQQSSTQQSYLKFATMIDGKRKMGYQAIGLGVDDLQFPADELLAAVAGVNGQPSLFISANVDLLNLGVFEPMRIIDKGGMKIGVTAVLGKEYQKEIRDPEIQMTDPDVALAKIVPELKKNADFLVLLANATAQESIALGKKFPEFNMVVTADSPPIPPREPKKIDGAKTWLIEVGHKGTDAIVIGLIDDPKEPCRYQRVPLDARFSASPDMKLLMAGYQEQLKGLGFAGLGLHAVQHPLEATSGEFVGSRKCESCHEISYDIWKKSGHSRAYATLVNLDPPRHFDPECISCHVIGWHPTKFFPYEGGFESMEKTPHLANTGCEDCHGPGEKHVAFELSGTESQKLEFRKAMVITKEESEKQQCATCHDLENSPNFDFKSYWPLIEHKEQVEE